MAHSVFGFLAVIFNLDDLVFQSVVSVRSYVGDFSLGPRRKEDLVLIEEVVLKASPENIASRDH